MKKALITGITGQDGSYLAELLLKKDYQVYGLQRRTSWPNTFRIDHIYDNPKFPNFTTLYGDLSESSNLNRVISKIQPDEIYNLGAQSHVGVSFDIPEYTANVAALGALRLLDALRDLRLGCRYYQASSSEMFGQVMEIPQTETTPVNPQSPYALSKVFAYYATKIYRHSYHLYAANGILFNHESPRRGVNFVTRKITQGLARIKTGILDNLRLGNLDAIRDWGYAKDYVEAIWKIIQYPVAEDFIIATGQTHSVREFVEAAGACLGMKIVWQGKGLKEKGVDQKTKKTIVSIDPGYFRKSEVEFLQGNADKAKKLLGWQPKTSFKQLVEIMAKADYDQAKIEAKTGKLIKVPYAKNRS